MVKKKKNKKRFISRKNPDTMFCFKNLVWDRSLSERLGSRMIRDLGGTKADEQLFLERLNNNAKITTFSKDTVYEATQPQLVMPTYFFKNQQELKEYDPEWAGQGVYVVDEQCYYEEHDGSWQKVN